MNSTLWRQIEIKRGASVPFGESGFWGAKKDRKAKTECEILQIRRLKGGVLFFLRKSIFTSIKQNDRGSFLQSSTLPQGTFFAFVISILTIGYSL